MSPGAGSLFPQPNVRTSRFEGRLDDLTGRGIRVTVRGDLDAAAETRFLALLASCEGTLIRLGSSAPAETPTPYVEELEAVMAPWLASLDQSVVIARPDNYVYGTAKTPAAGIAMLQQLLRHLSA